MVSPSVSPHCQHASKGARPLWWFVFLVSFAYSAPWSRADAAVSAETSIEALAAPNTCAQPNADDPVLNYYIAVIRDYIPALDDPMFPVRTEAKANIDRLVEAYFAYLDNIFTPGDAPVYFDKYRLMNDWLATCQANSTLELVRRLQLIITSVTERRDEKRLQMTDSLLQKIADRVNASRQITFLQALAEKIQGVLNNRILVDVQSVEQAIADQRRNIADAISNRELIESHPSYIALLQSLMPDLGDFSCEIVDVETRLWVTQSLVCTPDYSLLTGGLDQLISEPPLSFSVELSLAPGQNGSGPEGIVSLTPTRFPKPQVDLDTLPGISREEIADWMWLNEIIPDSLHGIVENFNGPLPTLEFLYSDVITGNGYQNRTNQPFSLAPFSNGSTAVILMRERDTYDLTNTYSLNSPTSGTQTVKEFVRHRLSDWFESVVVPGLSDR